MKFGFGDPSFFLSFESLRVLFPLNQKIRCFLFFLLQKMPSPRRTNMFKLLRDHTIHSGAGHGWRFPRGP